ncbi:MAG: class I fructose-bisphosphate aldolase [Akkermansiaceae bacterium]
MTTEHNLGHLAKRLVAPGKGVLAADESFSTIKKRLESVGVESSETTRRDYRQMLITTPGLGDFISGIILFDETIRQTTAEGEPLLEVIGRQGMIPGIKVDTGTVGMARFPGETITEGLDGLRGRLREYRELGARFTKWRAVIRITDELPTETCIRANAHLLARFAALSQEEGLVPIVEPEVLMDGDHSIARCHAVTEMTLRAVFDALFDQRVAFEEMLLKPNMVIAGTGCQSQPDAAEVAEATLNCFRRSVPAAVPGIVFLSGGQDEVSATRHLNEMHRLGRAPWELSFSYGRALQAPALNEWAGHHENRRAAQEILLHRAHCNSLARSGRYTQEMELDLCSIS